MAKKGKAKISKVKRNNQTTNKMRKQGKLKLQRHKNKEPKHRQQEKTQVEYSSEEESASGDEFADMLDDEEQKYILNRLSKQPQLLAHVPQEDKNKKRGNKRKREDKGPKPNKQAAMDSGAESAQSDSDIEEKYETEQAERPAKKVRALLPIKTKAGLEEREEVYEDTDSDRESEDIKQDPKLTQEESENSATEESDSGMEGTGEESEEQEQVVTTVDLLAARRDRLQHDKLRIGALCSSLLEAPEKKLKNLYPILYLMEERLKDGALNLHSIRKLATISAFEVFRDILPDYQIRHQDYSNVKLKKETLTLYKYEKELLEFYKRYLQRLEKAATVLRKKKGDTRKLEDATVSVAVVSLQCMCNMLVARPQFNYATNIAQSVVPFLDCGLQSAREIVTQCCAQVFADDNKGEITLTIVRLINQLVKRKGERLHPSSLDCLLTLKIRDVDLDAELDLKHKQARDEKHKKRIVNLSKKEKKRAKKLKEVERELLETQAQESEMARRKLLTEVTKAVFQIYFRLLKTAPKSKLLAAVLEGLAKFTHVINLEYYSALVSVLTGMMREEARPRERLLVVRTVLSVLAGAGDALNVDPANFHAALYSGALDAHAGSSDGDARLVVDAVWQVCSRARRVSPAVLQAFAKRLCTLATQLAHHGALACLMLLHQLATQSKSVSSLLEHEAEAAGSGRFDPCLGSPEHCNAHAAGPHELCALRRHYHPSVRAAADALLHRKSLTELGKLSPLQIFDQYDGSQMAFKPAIPPPKHVEASKCKGNSHSWALASLRDYCAEVESSIELYMK